MAGIIKDFKGAAVVAPGQNWGKEVNNILDREHNGYFNNVYYYDASDVRRDIRNAVSSGSGGVITPIVSTDNALVRWDGTSGMIVQNSVAILNDLGDLTGVRNFTATGTVILSGNTFPTTTGTSGQVLTTNGAGVLSWTTDAGGDVVGPGSSTDNALVRFDGTTGKLIQNSIATLSDLGDLTGVRNLTATGTPILGGNTYPVVTGSANQVLTTNGAGVLSWATNGTGDVVGPASATDNAVVRFDTTTGKLIQNGGILYDDNKNLTGVTSINRASGSTDYALGANTLVIAPTSTFAISGTLASSVLAGVSGTFTTRSNTNGAFVAAATAVAIPRGNTTAFIACNTMTDDSDDANDGIDNCFFAASNSCKIDLNNAGPASTLKQVSAISCSNCEYEAPGINTTNNMMYICSQFVDFPGNANFRLEGGYAAAGPAAAANRKFRIDFMTGQVSTNFAAGTYGNAGAAFQAGVAFDVAEMMENLIEGVAIPKGTILTAIGRKVRAAQPGEYIVGIVSSNPALICNDTPFEWQGRRVKDEWGIIQNEMIPDPTWEPAEGQTEADRPLIINDVENPAFNPDLENIPRSARPLEWTAVGYSGQIRTRIDASVVENAYIGVSEDVDGLGTHSDTPTPIRCLEVEVPYDAVKGYGVAVVKYPA